MIHAFEVLADLLGVFNNIRPHAQVFLYGHARKNVASFRHVREAHLDDRMRGNLLQVLAVQQDFARRRAQQSRNRMENGGFTRAVRADQGNQLAVVDGEVNPLERVNRAVVYVDILDFQHIVLLFP
ncbi:hypothetical protein SDC9_196924 [bioreactor metagenome]|uniref:Uncharacterized protein n=1 Tax=bioreactor metagenome TaxID=1076179 RepID=A0A645IDI2_9ZZZZ